MIDVRIRKLKDHEFRNAVAIIGYPSIGLVSSIASNFMSRELKLELVAGIESPDFPPYTVMQNGIPMPQMRIFSGLREPKDDEDGGIDCEDIVIVTSEFVPKVEHMYPIG
ncbi:MAG: PAC2 family protein, partial [Candidatus Methanomethylophilaceae archaeon]|nr:PAC2 family protein [Candidatus Methanomethylophilaceae archaeon]